MRRIHTYESFVNEGKLEDWNEEKNDLIQQIADMRNDMENDPEVIEQPDASEPGSKADWYGGELNKLEAQLEKIEAKIKKELETRAKRKDMRAQNKKEPTYEEVVLKDILDVLNSKIADIKQSQRSWPDRPLEQQAEIYKKRYGITDKTEDVVKALQYLQTQKKID